MDEHYSPVQQREALLPNMPEAFGPGNKSMPITAIIEYICSEEVRTFLESKDAKNMTVGELGSLLRPVIDTSFYGTSVKNPLLQRVISSDDLGALARRLDRYHNSACHSEKAALLKRAQHLRAEAAGLIKQWEESLGYETSRLAPPPQMPLFDWYQRYYQAAEKVQTALTSRILTRSPP